VRNHIEAAGIALLFIGIVILVGYFFAPTFLEMCLRGVFAYGWPIGGGILSLSPPPESVLERNPYIPVFGGLWQVHYYSGQVSVTVIGLMYLVPIAVIFLVAGGLLEHIGRKRS
jgi:hypothetical protein